MLDLMNAHPALMKELFIQTLTVLTAANLIGLFVPEYSPRGHVKFNRETAVVGFWRDWLLDVEGKAI